MDWAHIAETLVTTAIVAGSAYGAIKADLKALHTRIQRCEDDIRNLIFDKR